MKVEKQFSVFLANKPRVLAEVCQELAQARINIRAMSMMDSVEHGVLRIVPGDAAVARKVLQRLGLQVQETDVLCVTLPNRPGAVADLLIRLASANIKLSYAYVTSGAAGGKTIAVLKVNNVAKAQRAMENRKGGARDMTAKLRRPSPLR
ncbi:MAG: ACT domain-containing protein [Phycisphaerales bacterium]|nr:MAG: ACT domain-containing protein [Phycisphaerales bacterium]